MKYKIEIPKPCNENWNKMSPTEKGAFCSQCQKEVIDFRKFTNSELIEYLQKNENACGRFYKNQISRDIVLSQNKKPNRLGLFFGIFSLFFNASIFAQQTKAEIEIIENKKNDSENSNKYIEINGVVRDNEEVLSGAIIQLKGTKNAVSSDINGAFSIKIPIDFFNKNTYLIVELLGYKKTEIRVFKDSKNIDVKMRESSCQLKGNIVTGKALIKK